MSLPEEVPAAQSVPLEPAMVARFDPMFRALISFGLVERSPIADPGADSEWRLVPSVQRRLESLFSPLPPAEKLIYFGHRCRSCGEHGPTRLNAGVYLCEPCRRLVQERVPLDAAGA